MLVKARLGYGSEKIIKELSPLAYDGLRTKIPWFPEDQTKFDHWTHSGIVDEEGIRTLATLKISVDLESAVEDCMLVKLQDRIRALELRDESGSDAALAANGAIVQIHIPDLGLLYMNEVTWLEDACTEELQVRLDKGWKILAVCPPNAQRRPDYILGRRK